MTHDEERVAKLFHILYTQGETPEFWMLFVETWNMPKELFDKYRLPRYKQDDIVAWHERVHAIYGRTLGTIK